MAGKGPTQVDVLQPVLTGRAAEFLRPHVAGVRFLADAGFRDCDWAELCLKMGWHYNTPKADIAFNTYLLDTNGQSAALNERVPYVPHHCQRRFLERQSIEKLQ